MIVMAWNLLGIDYACRYVWYYNHGAISIDLPSFSSHPGVIFTSCYSFVVQLNTLRPRQNGRHFPDDIFKCIFLNENVGIPIKISLKFVPKGPINNIPALVQITAWRRSGDKPLSKPMMVNSLTHICVTRPPLLSNILFRQTSAKQS